MKAWNSKVGSPWCRALVAGLLLFWAAPPAIAELAGHGGFVKGVAVSPDGRLAASASFDYRLILWDIDSQSELRTFDEHGGAVNSVAFTPDGRHLLSGSDDGTLLLWDVATVKALHRFEAHQGKVASVAISPDGRLAASAARQARWKR